MPTPKKGARLGGSAAHQRLLLSNLATQLFEHGSVTTTEAKARTLRPVAEKLITKARKAQAGENPLHQRREVLKTIRDKGVVHVLFTEIGPGFADRPGGYTRITKLGPRRGDNAPMALIELVTDEYTPSAPRPTRAAAAPATAPAEDTTADATGSDDAAAADLTEVDGDVADDTVAANDDADAPSADTAEDEVVTQADVDADETPAEKPEA